MKTKTINLTTKEITSLKNMIKYYLDTTNHIIFNYELSLLNKNKTIEQKDKIRKSINQEKEKKEELINILIKLK